MTVTRLTNNNENWSWLFLYVYWNWIINLINQTIIEMELFDCWSRGENIWTSQSICSFKEDRAQLFKNIEFKSKSFYSWSEIDGTIFHKNSNCWISWPKEVKKQIFWLMCLSPVDNAKYCCLTNFCYTKAIRTRVSLIFQVLSQLQRIKFNFL